MPLILICGDFLFEVIEAGLGADVAFARRDTPPLVGFGLTARYAFAI